jgi:hypothetical protein
VDFFERLEVCVQMNRFSIFGLERDSGSMSMKIGINPHVLSNFESGSWRGHPKSPKSYMKVATKSFSRKSLFALMQINRSVEKKGWAKGGARKKMLGGRSPR